ncbi:SspB family protein [Salinarimonas soli]|uniref:Stringent starvation protein B n=1 Tax=Salinarimonas soli TaxID=1638099 RepID=A0A5B2V8N1_9HYPH|nr:SspB family protein [Salinarimonas soli]KAA2235341.1 Stringent starvation protein B [Salinarimonas soli]
MAKDLIRYDLLVQDALKGVVRKVLGDATREGLQGDHHFYISFRTDFPGVRLSQRMREKYPQDMTIVLQHQFWDLGITEHAFEVGLSFSGVPERLLIPFDALTGFFDPSVHFGLKFEIQDAAAGADESAAPVGDSAPPVALPTRPAPEPSRAAESAADNDKPTADGSASGAEVVSLDAFRKKP